jgi:hypothetical protein
MNVLVSPLAFLRIFPAARVNVGRSMVTDAGLAAP